jgi:D-alanyl-D-alanine carboxypeptidase (penicillin-binding protein 5/6)
VAGEDLSVLMPALASSQVAAEVVFRGPLEAPIAQGEALAELVFTPEGLPEVRLPLVADRDVARGGFVSRMTTAAMLLVNRMLQGPEEQS